MKHIKIFEDFNQFKKPSLLQKAFQAGKRFIGYERKEDRESLDKIYRAIGYKDPSGIPNRSFVENFR